MKQTIAYGAYFLVAAIVTCVVNFISLYMISGILFYAADAPPGDISLGGKWILAVGMPIMYAAFLFGVYYVYRSFWGNWNIRLRLNVGVIFHLLIAAYLIWHAVPYAF